MRITKKFLREAKAALSHRIKRVCTMNDEQIRLEFNRMFPAEHRPAANEPGLDSTDLLRWRILSWSVEATLPSHLVD